MHYWVFWYALCFVFAELEMRQARKYWRDKERADNARYNVEQGPYR